jgi:hypothetical protein
MNESLQGTSAVRTHRSSRVKRPLLRRSLSLSLSMAMALLVSGLLPRPAHAQPPAKYSYWILAEGAANDFFDEDILIGNPNATAATVKITLLPEGGLPVVVPNFTVLASSRYTFNVKNELPDSGGSVSAIVESVDGQPLVVERTMTWYFGQRRGGHNSPGVLATAPTWYLAEGTTGFFNTYILITNPDPAQDAAVDVRYLREVSGPITQSIVVPKNGRVTIWVNAGLDLDNNGQPDTTIEEPFSTVVQSTNGVNIAVERSMYWNDFKGGHESTAVTTPHDTWLFAEGNTGGDANFSWETYLLLANPQDTPANVTVTFFRETGGPLTYETSVGANRRTTLRISTLDVNNDGTPDLPNASFSTRVDSTNDVAIIAERAMYWTSNGITFIEGHDTPGVNAEAQKWAFAEGAEGRIDETNIPYSSFFLVSNATTGVLNLKATFVREDGTGLVRTFDVPAQSRFTLPTSSNPELRHRRFAAFLESTNGVPFVAERAVYWGDGFYGGTASVGTPWDETVAAPPVATLNPTVTTVTPNTGALAGGTVVTIAGTNFVEELTGTGTGTKVKFGTADATSVTVLNGTTLTATVPAGAQAGAVDVVVSNTHINAAWVAGTLTGGFTYTAAPEPEPEPNPNPPALPDVQAQIAQWTAERPDLFAQQCAAGVKYVNSPWQDYIVDRLRQTDTRWGYNGKPTRTAADNGGRPVIAAGDELAYFYGTGTAQGSTEVYLVDILFGHCGPAPETTWRVFTGQEPGFWTGAGRF